MNRSRILSVIKPKDLTYSGKDVELLIIGIFETIKMNWLYYAVSAIAKGNGYEFSPDMHSNHGMTVNTDNVYHYGKKFASMDEAKAHCNQFKLKWESGSNNTTQEVRDEKIEDILNQTKK